MKKCPTCATEDQTAFYETQASLYCKPCHKDRYFGKGRQRLAQAKLAVGGCKDCDRKVTPETTYLFDWDHVTDTKISNLSALTTASEKRFTEEIAKCELRCVLCHRIRTHNTPRTHPLGGRPRKPVAPPPTPDDTQPTGVRNFGSMTELLDASLHS
jgi:hypothetical protein